jgi:hypothetical protein
MRSHLGRLSMVRVDWVPNLYSIRISGHLGPTALSGFPSMVSQLKGEDTLAPASWIGPPCTASWPRSRRLGWTSSSSADCCRSTRHPEQVVVVRHDPARRDAQLLGWTASGLSVLYEFLRGTFSQTHQAASHRNRVVPGHHDRTHAGFMSHAPIRDPVADRVVTVPESRQGLRQQLAPRGPGMGSWPPNRSSSWCSGLASGLAK